MSSEETTAKRVPFTLESVVLRLRSLKRYDVGSGDDGDEHLYDYHDEDKNGDWIKASDIYGIIQWIEQNTKAHGQPRGEDVP